MLCKRCNEQMKHVLRFQKNITQEFYRCSRCYTESKSWFIILNKKQDRKSKKEEHYKDSRGKKNE